VNTDGPLTSGTDIDVVAKPVGRRRSARYCLRTLFTGFPVKDKEYPFDEIIEGFTFTACGLNVYPHLDVSDILQLYTGCE
jgi:hypothetical protein